MSLALFRSGKFEKVRESLGKVRKGRERSGKFGKGQERSGKVGKGRESSGKVMSDITFAGSPYLPFCTYFATTICNP